MASLHCRLNRECSCDARREWAALPRRAGARSVRRGTKVGRLARLGRAADATFLVWHLVSSVDRCARRSHHAEPLIPSPSSTLRRPSSCRPLAAATPCCVAAARPRPRACCGAPWPAAAALALAPRAASTRRATLDGLACRAPSSSTSLSPRGGDGPKTTLSHRCDRVGVRLRYVARWIRPAGREAHNMAKQPALSTGAPPVLVPAMVPAGGKSSRLWNPPA